MLPPMCKYIFSSVIACERFGVMCFNPAYSLIFTT